MRNDGAGNLTLAMGHFPFPGTQAGTIGLGDLDGDLDAVFSEVLHPTPQAWILGNDGTGRFGSFSLVANVRRIVTLADCDADGDLDILSAGHHGTDHAVVVHLNDGSGTFAQATSLPLPPASWTIRLIPLDLDDDGDGDVAASGDTLQGDEPWTRLFVNEGRGVFRALPADSALDAMRPLAAADLDRDGDVDVVGSDHLYANRHRHVATPYAARLGYGFPVQVWAGVGTATGPNLATLFAAPRLRPSALAIPGIGTLFLDERVTHDVLTVLVPPNGPATLPLAVPVTPALAGAALHLQAVVFAPGTLPRLTNVSTDTLLR